MLALDVHRETYRVSGGIPEFEPQDAEIVQHQRNRRHVPSPPKKDKDQPKEQTQPASTSHSKPSKPVASSKAEKPFHSPVPLPAYNPSTELLTPSGDLVDVLEYSHRADAFPLTIVTTHVTSTSKLWARDFPPLMAKNRRQYSQQHGYGVVVASTPYVQSTFFKQLYSDLAPKQDQLCKLRTDSGNWIKAAAALHTLYRLPRDEWIWWTDGDLFITNYSVPIHLWLEEQLSAEGVTSFPPHVAAQYADIPKPYSSPDNISIVFTLHPTDGNPDSVPKIKSQNLCCCGYFEDKVATRPNGGSFLVKNNDIGRKFLWDWMCFKGTDISRFKHRWPYMG